MLNLLIASFLSVIVTPNSLAMVTEIDSKVGPFGLKSSEIKAVDDDKYAVKRYEDSHGYFVEQRQSFPIILTTNFFISAESKSMTNAYHYTDNQDETYVTVVDTQALSLFIKNFLGDVGITERELEISYDVQTNLGKDKLTTIFCYIKKKDVWDYRPGKDMKFFLLKPSFWQSILLILVQQHQKMSDIKLFYIIWTIVQKNIP